MKKPFSILTVLLYLLCTTPVQATPKQFIVGVENLNFFPIYATKEKSLSYHGFAKDLLELFARESNYLFYYKPLPIKRLLRDFIKKQIDLKFPDSKFWSAKQKKAFNITYSDPVVTIRGAVMTIPEKSGIKKTPYVMGIILGFTPWQFTRKIEMGEIKLQYVPTAKILFRLAMKGRIDGAFTELSVPRYYLKKIGKEGALVADQSMLKIVPETYHISSIKHPKIIQKFNRFLNKNKKVIKELKKRYNIL